MINLEEFLPSNIISLAFYYNVLYITISLIQRYTISKLIFLTKGSQEARPRWTTSGMKFKNFKNAENGIWMEIWNFISFRIWKSWEKPKLDKLDIQRNFDIW